MQRMNYEIKGGMRWRQCNRRLGLERAEWRAVLIQWRDGKKSSESL